MKISEIKKEVIKILDARGWDDKFKVDLRNKQSMINYLKFYEVWKGGKND